MRLVSALGVLLLLGICSGAVLADKYELNEKDWSYNLSTPRAIVPEVEPNNTCPGQAIACGDDVQPASLVTSDQDWYSFNVGVEGSLITIGTDTWNGSSTDTYLELYNACGGPIIAQDDDSGPGLFSLISQYGPVPAGTYYVKVRGYSPSSVGEYKMFVRCEGGGQIPTGDTCADPFLDIVRCSTGAVAGDLTPMRNDYDPGSGGCATGYPEAGRDAAYQIYLEAGDICHFVYTGNSYDAAIYLVRDCSNVPGSCVAGSDAGYNIETLNYTVPNGGTGTYYLIADAYGTNSGGTYTLSYEIVCPTPLGVCCVGHSCYLIMEGECASMQGHWHPEWTSCNPNPCDIYTPADQTSWGQIKNSYR